MNEFALIEAYFKHLGADSGAPACDMGIGDDCALLSVPSGYQLVVSSDTLIRGVHFPESTPAYDIGYKALAVNLSDLAAMGATPAWFSLCITLPEFDEQWLGQFCHGIDTLVRSTPIRLIGGDTTKGVLSVSIQVMGLVKSGQALCRHGANVGDDVYVSGRLGEAGIGLRLVLDEPILPRMNSSQCAYYLNRLNRPSPRVVLGQSLLNIASSCIDVSDGLLADLNHTLDRSGKVGAILDLKNIPIAECLMTTEQAAEFGFNNENKAREFAINAGDDYELCFTARPSHRNAIQGLATQLVVPVQRIGTVVEEPGVYDIAGNFVNVRGYRHFQ